jgi:hypothetical protein
METQFLTGKAASPCAGEPAIVGVRETVIDERKTRI